MVQGIFNCAREISRFFKDEVLVPLEEKNEIYQRSLINRRRLKAGLKILGHPQPREFILQGSYAMETMIKHAARDYDIDDGVYFNGHDLKGPRGGEFSSLSARQRVSDALYDLRFNKLPEIRKHCVRVYFDKGYRIDMPVYRVVRRSTGLGPHNSPYQLASTDWKVSNPQAVTAWFKKENAKLSPNEINGGQLRRVCCLLKKFAQSRDSWKGKITNGFIITKLATECYCPFPRRDDISLVTTANLIFRRLSQTLLVKHPIFEEEIISNGLFDVRVSFLRDKLDEGLNQLSKLIDPDCSRDIAMKALDGFFYSEFFRYKV